MNIHYESLLRLAAIWISASALLMAQVPSHSSSDDDNWDSRFGATVDGEVYAVASAGNDVYIGGNFTAAGGVPAANIARWNGSQWQALGTGADGAVYALTLSDNGVLYAG